MANRRQKYIALTNIENESGSMRWMMGSEINLTNEQAIKLLSNGLVEPCEGTKPPDLRKPPATIVEPGENADLDGEAVTEVKDS